MQLACLVLIGLVQTFPPTARAADAGIPYRLADDLRTITVGVRQNTEPFAYLRPDKAKKQILKGYGGYMVEACRAVLKQVVSSGYFRNYQIKHVDVSASNRFDKLDAGEVDLLCGPDSITTDRLRQYNVSHPIFLSGIALAKVGSQAMPRSVYCGPIVGVVKGTTSQLAGLRAVADADVVGRFKPAIIGYLETYDNQDQVQYKSTVSRTWKDFATALLGNDQALTYDHRGEDGLKQGAVTTAECPGGFVSGPVIEYDSHRSGVDDLCDGRILYYLGDVDIIKRQLKDGCDVEISQRTFTKEAYGVYFRRAQFLDADEFREQANVDALLYSEFNGILLTQMQSSEQLLENLYEYEFRSADMAADLANFFKSFQYATNR